MNDDLVGGIILLSLVLAIVIFAGKGCNDNQIRDNAHKQAMEKMYLEQGYIEQEFCNAYGKKWIKP